MQVRGWVHFSLENMNQSFPFPFKYISLSQPQQVRPKLLFYQNFYQDFKGTQVPGPGSNYSVSIYWARKEVRKEKQEEKDAYMERKIPKGFQGCSTLSLAILEKDRATHFLVSQNNFPVTHPPTLCHQKALCWQTDLNWWRLANPSQCLRVGQNPGAKQYPWLLICWTHRALFCNLPLGCGWVEPINI